MQEIKKISFIQAVSSVCVSREIFLSLKNQRVWRTLFHIIFLAFLCSLFIMIAGHNAMLEKIDRPLDLFEESAGGIVIKDGAIYPAKDADKAYETMLIPRMKLVYSPNYSSFNCNWINKDGITVLWFPRFWCVTITEKGTQLIKSFSGYPSSSMQDMTEHESIDDLMKYLAKRNSNSKENVKSNDKRTLTFSRMEIEQMYIGSLFFYFWFEFAFQTLFLTLLFSVFYRFIGARGMTGLSFKEIFCSGTYAAVPAMLVASFFPAFELPFIPYETVFMAGFFIYFLSVLNYLERSVRDTENTSSQPGDQI